jgi:hypothetical protein
MKKILLLAAFASTSFSGVAMAGFCADHPAYNVTVAGTVAGTASFTPSTAAGSSYAGLSGAHAACGYAMDWKSPGADETSGSASCNVAQLGVYGQSVCGVDTPATHDSLGAPLLSVAGCQGFDAAGVVQTMSFMVSAGGDGCKMNGLASYSFYPYALQAITFD